MHLCRHTPPCKEGTREERAVRTGERGWGAGPDEDTGICEHRDGNCRRQSTKEDRLSTIKTEREGGGDGAETNGGDANKHKKRGIIQSEEEIARQVTRGAWGGSARTSSEVDAGPSTKSVTFPSVSKTSGSCHPPQNQAKARMCIAGAH